jgi:hypothetical protein
MSIIHSIPIRPYFLLEFELELVETALHLRNLKKVQIIRDEVKNGSICFKAEIDAFKTKELEPENIFI